MAARIERPFQTLLDDCGVSDEFQKFLLESTLVNPARFLAAIPRCIDDDLIEAYRNNGARPSIPELVNIRMVYTLCKDAEADAKAARAVVKASPETATIPDHDKRLMKEMFLNLHGWIISEKKLLNIDLLNQLFHQLTCSPKSLKFTSVRSCVYPGPSLWLSEGR